MSRVAHAMIAVPLDDHFFRFSRKGEDFAAMGNRNGLIGVPMKYKQIINDGYIAGDVELKLFPVKRWRKISGIFSVLSGWDYGSAFNGRRYGHDCPGFDSSGHRQANGPAHAAAEQSKAGD